MNITLAIEEETLGRARRSAEAVGKSVNQLVREYLEQLGGKPDAAADADEFARLSRESGGNSRGWKFERAEIHERRG